MKEAIFAAARPWLQLGVAINTNILVCRLKRTSCGVRMKNHLLRWLGYA